MGSPNFSLLTSRFSLLFPLGHHRIPQLAQRLVLDLPHKKVAMTYDLEYGTDTLEMHADSMVKGHRVLIVDDLLATGGTMKACCDLVEQTGAEIVGVACLIELAGLNGREKLGKYHIHTVLRY